MKIYEVGSVCLSMTKDNTENFLGEVETIKELNKFLYDYQEKIGYSHHYTRCMPAKNVEGAEAEDGVVFDVGSYSKFLYVTGITFAQLLAYDQQNMEDENE